VLSEELFHQSRRPKFLKKLHKREKQHLVLTPHVIEQSTNHRRAIKGEKKAINTLASPSYPLFPSFILHPSKAQEVKKRKKRKSTSPP